MRIYYNEFDPAKVRLLKLLMDSGELPFGDIDGRSIDDVDESDLIGYDQCHFFAGVGAWAVAVKDLEFRGTVWTGSCPCQPFSQGGLKKGVEDERHLFPRWHHLIKQRKPAIVFGEQVASELGRAWLDAVRASLESAGYSFAASILPAASVGAPHDRPRTYFVSVENSYSARGLRTVRTPSDFGWKAAKRRNSGDGMRVQKKSSDSGVRVPVLGDLWGNPRYIEARIGVLRQIQPGLVPVVNGVPQQLGVSSGTLIKAFGDAIVLPLAREFVLSAHEAICECS